MASLRRLEDQPDAALIDRFLDDGDETAFRVLYRRHAAPVRAIVGRLLGARRAEAEDAVQDTWLAACRALRDYRGEAKFSTWLITIAIRVTRRRLVLADREHMELTDDVVVDRPVSADPIDLDRSLAQLSDAQRAVVVLHDLEGLTHAQIADQLGLAAGTSRSLLTRGRRALRELLRGKSEHGLRNARST